MPRRRVSGGRGGMQERRRTFLTVSK
jgi:hypothetical protein